VKKLLTVFLAVLVIGLAFSETVNIEFWHGMGAAQGETLSALVENFNKTNPDIQVDSIYVGGYGDLNRKLLSTITAAKEGSTNDLPTITQAYGNWIAKYLYSDVIEPLNPYIENDPQMKRVWEEEIYEVFKEGSTWGDTIYSIPFNKSVYVYSQFIQFHLTNQFMFTITTQTYLTYMELLHQKQWMNSWK